MKRALQSGSGESEHDLPPPPRAGYRPANAKSKRKRTSETSLPLLIKIGLMLIAGLIALGGSGMLYFGITSGHPEAFWPAIAILSTCVFGGIAVVCNLKLLFMGHACGYGGLPAYMPFRRLVWILTNLSETGLLFFGNLAGIGALVIVWAMTIPVLKGMTAPKHAAVVPAQAVRGDQHPGRIR